MSYETTTIYRPGKSNLTWGKNTTHRVGAQLWNNLPKYLTDLTEINAFKKELKSLYLAQYQ